MGSDGISGIANAQAASRTMGHVETNLISCQSAVSKLDETLDLLYKELMPILGEENPTVAAPETKDPEIEYTGTSPAARAAKEIEMRINSLTRRVNEYTRRVEA